MVKVTAPMLSLAASGTLGKAVTFSNWKGRAYVRSRVIPANPQSGLQVGMRAGITACSDFWNNALTAPGRASWNAGVGTEAISGFNLFTRISQQNVRNNYALCISFTDRDRSETPPAPAAPAAAQDGTDMDITWTDEATSQGVLIFHSLTTPFTPSAINLVAIVRKTLQAWTHRNPGVGTHYYDIRSMGVDGGVGALAGEFTGTIV